MLFTEYINDAMEAGELIKEIQKNKNLSNTAILYRANSQSKKIEEACNLNFEILEKYNLIQISDNERKKIEECDKKNDLSEKKNVIKMCLAHNY